MEGKIEEFFEEILGRKENVIKEIDVVLKDSETGGVNYFPTSIWNVLQTKAISRMSRIRQLGEKTYKGTGMEQTRLEHSKGTYYRTLMMLQRLYQDENIRKMVEEKGYQKYMVASLMRALLHDVGHPALSHTMEVVCCLPRSFHEDVGERMKNEDEELNGRLKEVYPDLPRLIKEVEEKNFLGLNRLFEGQIDLDRADYLPRDCFHIKDGYEETIQGVNGMLQNVSIQKVTDKRGKKVLAPVFEENQMQNIETFLLQRFNNYKNIYWSRSAFACEHVFKMFASRLVQSDENSEIKHFFKNNINRKAKDVDLPEYISFDDIEIFKGVLEVAKTTKDEYLRKLAILSLPNPAMLESTHRMMVSEEKVINGRRVGGLSESDKEFIQDLSSMSIETSELGKMLRDCDYDSNCIILKSDKPEDVEHIIGQLTGVLGIEEGNPEEQGLISWERKISTYKSKEGEEIYIKNSDGNVYEYNEHPARKQPILEETTAGFCLLVPVLEEKGYTKEQIEQAKRIVEEFNRNAIRKKEEETQLS